MIEYKEITPTFVRLGISVGCDKVAFVELPSDISDSELAEFKRQVATLKVNQKIACNG